MATDVKNKISRFDSTSAGNRNNICCQKCSEKKNTTVFT